MKSLTVNDVSVASLMQPRSSTHVPVTFGELYGPVACSLCAADAWVIWVTPEEKETHSFEHIFRYHGVARCDKCGPPNDKAERRREENSMTNNDQPNQSATSPTNGNAVRSGDWLGTDQIRAERERQISGEGWGPEDDDEHTEGEMIAAAIAYAVAAHDQVIGEALPDGPPATWPWEAGWWKRDADPMRNLVKAGALIAAEIDRLNRERTKVPSDVSATERT